MEQALTHCVRGVLSKRWLVRVPQLDNLSIYDVLRADKLVFDSSSISKINEAYSA